MKRSCSITILVALCLFLGVSAPAADWSSLPLLDSREVPDLFVDNDTLYVAAVANIYRHPAGTTEWIPSAEIGPDIEISRVFKTHNRLFAGTFQHGVYESSDGGASWTPRSTGLSGAGSLAITAFAVRGDSLYVGTSGAGVWVLPLNGGTTWQAFRTGMPWNTAWDVYTLYNFDGTLFAGAGQSAHIFRNVTGSASWEAIMFTGMSGAGVAMLDFDRSGDTLLGAGFTGLFNSADTGSTWTTSPGPWNPAGDASIAVTPLRILGMLAYGNHGTYLYEHDGIGWQPFDHLATTVAYDMVAFDNRIFLAHFTGLLSTPLDPTDISDPGPTLPSTPLLLQNFPNPFNPTTTIAYDLPSTGAVTLSVINVVGQHVSTLVNSRQGRGRHSVVWDGTDSSGRRVASGIYFYRLTVDSLGVTRKMLLLK